MNWECRAARSATHSPRSLRKACCVAFVNHVYATIGHLVRRGYPVPKVAAVTSCRDTVLLAGSIPTIARYQMSAEKLGRGAARLMLQALNPATTTAGGQAPG